MATKQNSYIQEELDWLKSKADEIRAYVEANPYHLVQDRTTTKYTKFGDPYEDVVQKIEVIQKSLRDSMKDYSQIVEVINTLREKEVAKVEARGNAKISKLAEGFLKGK